jgi:hypothetical protein
VRFAAIDLNAKIEFSSIKMVPMREAEENSVTFAVGQITYAENPTERSVLVYLKPTYFYQTAPIDVRSYGTTSPTFPHETTLDQWFGEAQFESYRRLGEYLMGKLYDVQLPKMQPPLPQGAEKGHTLEQFFVAAAS